jgi:hypothetical protein
MLSWAHHLSQCSHEKNLDHGTNKILIIQLSVTCITQYMVSKALPTYHYIYSPYRMVYKLYSCMNVTEQSTNQGYSALGCDIMCM